MKSNKIIIGTRGSILALAQAEKVKEMLIKKYDERKSRKRYQYSCFFLREARFTRINTGSFRRLI